MEGALFFLLSNDGDAFDEPRRFVIDAVTGRPFSSSRTGQHRPPPPLLLEGESTSECRKRASPPGASVCLFHQVGFRRGVRQACSLRVSLPMSVFMPFQYAPGAGTQSFSAARPQIIISTGLILARAQLGFRICRSARLRLTCL